MEITSTGGWRKDPVESPNDWDSIFEEGFEAELDNFQNAGNKIVSNKYHTGASSARVRRRQKLKSTEKIISEYTDLMVDFYYYSQGMEEGESFTLEIKMDSSAWTEVGRWTRGEDFENDEWYPGTVTVPNGKDNALFRFSGQGNQGNDKIYIDNITFSGKFE